MDQTRPAIELHIIKFFCSKKALESLAFDCLKIFSKVSINYTCCENRQ